MAWDFLQPYYSLKLPPGVGRAICSKHEPEISAAHPGKILQFLALCLCVCVCVLRWLYDPRTKSAVVLPDFMFHSVSVVFFPAR